MTSASFDLGDLWRHYCAKAMGLPIDWESHDKDQHDVAESSKEISFVSLIPTSAPHSTEDDAWIQTAKQVQQNINQMSSWMQAKKKDFLSVQMSDQEAALIQSTVTSFCAQTANEIESLHTVVSASDEVSQHRLGIVQMLMANLKEQVAESFKQLCKQRKRPAVALWQTPLQCRHIHGTPFQPTRQSHRLHLDFWDAYAAPVPVDRPVSILNQLSDSNIATAAPPEPFGASSKIADQSLASEAYDKFQEHTESTNEAILQQEAVLLQQVTNNDLDAVQKMEEMMVNITTLISQFASLVSEQQDDVYDIHNNAAEAKQNMTKGQENLADAKERTRASQHFMAKGIFAMAIMLFLLHWMRP